MRFWQSRSLKQTVFEREGKSIDSREDVLMKGTAKKCSLLLLSACLAIIQMGVVGSISPAYADSEVNVALGIQNVTSSTNHVKLGTLSYLTDGNRTTNQYALIDAAEDPQWVQVDLGEAYPISRINVLNDFNPDAPRKGRGIIVQVSNDPGFDSGVTTLFNNDSANAAGQGAGTDLEYTEPVNGSGNSIVPASPVTARYVRSWAYGNVLLSTGEWRTVNTPVELEVYTTVKGTDAALPVIGTLAAANPTVNSAELSWVSPGTSVVGYDIRYSTSPITEANWDNGLTVKKVYGEPAPAGSGLTQNMLAKGLPPGSTLYFAMKTIGSDGKTSALSNSPTAATQLVINVAKNKPLTLKDPTKMTYGQLSHLNDGKVDNRNEYVLVQVADGPQWVQVDLEQPFDVQRVNIRSDWGSDANSRRVARDYIVQLSDDPTFTTGVTTIYNNDKDNSSGQGVGTDDPFVEAADGSGKNIILDDTVSARYVRWWANGHDRLSGAYNSVNTMLELQVFADPMDETAPSAISDLASAYTTWKTAELNWTAPGNDGVTGRASEFQVRYSLSPITTESAWNAATPVTIGIPAPLAAGSPQSMVVEGLTAGTSYYFAIKTLDHVPNASPLSNTIQATTKVTDVVAPSALTDLTATRSQAKSIQLRWTAPGDDGLYGKADKYEVRYSTSPIVSESDWNAALQAEDELPQKVPGSAMIYQLNELQTGVTYYMAVRTTDYSGNVSGLSNPVSATTHASAPDSMTVTSLADLQTAINTAPHSGRIITLAAGTYSQTTTIQVTDRDNITIQGATSDRDDTVISGPGIDGPMDINLKINQSSYFTIRNLTIKDSYYHAVQVNYGSHYFHADNVKTWDNGEGGFKVTGAGNVASGNPYSDFGLIENSHMGYSTTGKRGAVEGIDLIAAKKWVIRGNFFENTYHSNYRGGYAFFAKGNSIDTLVENNVFKNNFIAISFGGGGTGATFFRHGDTRYEHQGGIIRNNVVYNTNDTGVYLNKANNFQVYNNTLMNISPSVVVGAIEPRYVESTGIIRNNLMDRPVNLRNGATATQSNNISNAVSSFFLDAANGDYRLHGYMGAAARDAGYNLTGLVDADMAGLSRPQGSAYDVGAYEFAPLETVPPAAIADLAVGPMGASTHTIQLQWTAPGDSGTTGTAFMYDLRYARTPITAANWDLATTARVAGMPQPMVAGTVQSADVIGVPTGVPLFFAMKTADSQGNVSGLSNVMTASTTVSGTDYSLTADTYTASNGNYTTHGTVKTLQVTTNTTINNSYLKLKFDRYAGEQTNLALLYFYVRDDVARNYNTLPVPYTFYGFADTSWTETGTNALLRDSLPNMSDAVRIGSLDVYDKGWYAMDITDYVNEHLSNDSTELSIQIIDGSNPRVGKYTYFYSRENEFHQPFLFISSDPDTTPPGSVVDLKAEPFTPNTALVSWTATGDRGYLGVSTEFDIRYSSSPITEANWSSATQVVGEPTPLVAGTVQQMYVYGLTPNTDYYFAMKSIDKANNVSELSNLAVLNTGNGVNVAKNKNVSVKTPALHTYGQLSWLTDGKTDNRNEYALVGVAGGPEWVQVDLGQSYDVQRVNIRSDWGSDATTERIGKDYVVMLSNDPTFATGVTTIFNNDADNSSGYGVGTDAEYIENRDGSGKDIVLSSNVNARYVRYSANGHVRVATGVYNPVNTVMEIEVYADSGDYVAPSDVTDLAVTYTTWKSASLSWTAPGNDGVIGTAVSYHLRYSTVPITSETAWNDATPVTGMPAPQAAGTVQRKTVEGLTPNTTYYFALKTLDNVPNFSGLSNSASTTTNVNDPVAPGAITDLQISRVNAKSMLLGWTAPGDDGNVGTASSYQVRYSTSPIVTESDWLAATEAEDELLQKSTGSSMVYQLNELNTGVRYFVAVRTVDGAGNMSDLSNAADATTQAALPDSVTVSSLADLQTAINTAPAAGRIITLTPGTYNQSVTISITNKDNITIQGGTSNRGDTILRGLGIDGNLYVNVTLNNSSYITIKNLTLRDTYYHGVQVNSGSHYFHADNIMSWDHGEGAFKVTGAGNVANGNPYSDFGVIENSRMGYSTTGRRTVVESIDIVAAKNWVIRGNTFENTFTSNKSNGYAFFAKGNSIGTIVENNVFNNNFIAMSFGGGGTGAQFFRHGDTSFEHRGGIMRNNIVNGTGDTAVYMNKALNFEVYNNTLVNIAPTVAVGSIEARFAGTTGIIRNNLTDKLIKLRDSGTAVQSNNYITASSSMFVNAAAGDFRLQPTAAAAIDQGYNLAGLVNTDIAGTTRPVGVAYDLGAYEWSAVSSLSAPTGLTAVAGEDGITVNWSAVSGAAGYRVKRAITPGGPYTLLGSPTVTSYADASAAPNIVYFYTVSAYNGATESTASAEVSAVIDASPPVTTAALSPAAPDGMGGAYLSPVTVTLSAVDTLSAVTGTVYSLDGGTTWQTYSVPLVFEKQGVYTVHYRSTDTAGNVETAQTVSFTLAASLVRVQLRSSAGQPLSGGVVKYLDGTWKDFGVTDASGTASLPLTDKSYTFSIVYEGTTKSVTQHTGTAAAVVFQTSLVQVQLKDSLGNPLGTGAVDYYSTSWHTLGNTAGGTAGKELFPGTYTFRVNYEGTSAQKSQNVASNPIVVFNTISVKVQLRDSLGGALDTGVVEYYNATSWQQFGSTSGGEVSKELFPGTLSVRISYEGTTAQKSQNTAANATIEFATLLVKIQLKDAAGNLIDTGTARYFGSGAWHSLGNTSGGEIAKELLTGTYAFGMTYGGVYKQSNYNLASNPTVVFQY